MKEVIVVRVLGVFSSSEGKRGLRGRATYGLCSAVSFCLYLDLEFGRRLKFTKMGFSNHTKMGL
jgi:hypothetical protein